MIEMRWYALVISTYAPDNKGTEQATLVLFLSVLIKHQSPFPSMWWDVYIVKETWPCADRMPMSWFSLPGYLSRIELKSNHPWTFTLFPFNYSLFHQLSEQVPCWMREYVQINSRYVAVLVMFWGRQQDLGSWTNPFASSMQHYHISKWETKKKKILIFQWLFYTLKDKQNVKTSFFLIKYYSLQ